MVSVIDGDTFRTATGRRVRLRNVYAPEKGQPGADRATRILKGLIGGKVVSITLTGSKSYGRDVAEVRYGGRSVNAAMRQAGYG